jgi:hypothetical protein
MSGFAFGAAVNHGAVGTADFDTHYLVSTAGAAATELGHGQFLFDETTHVLSWDSDGMGAHAAVAIATLNGVTTLHASDFDLK